MKNKIRITSIIILTVTSLVACERSAPTGDSPVAIDDISSIFRVAETLTAQATAEVNNNAGDATDINNPASVEPTNNSLDLFSSTSTSTSTSAVPLVVTAVATNGLTAAPTEPETVPTTYTLHKQEYPYCIARRFNVDITALLTASGLTASSLYFEGQVLTIPQGGAPFAGERMLISHPTQYTVQAGDSLYWISCKFGDVYPESIAQANSIGIDATLTVGQVLQIP